MTITTSGSEIRQRNLLANPIRFPRPVKFTSVLLIAATVSAGPRLAFAQPETMIRSTTRLVQVQVVALDDQGRRVTDLRKEDFQVFDDRKEQRLVSFAVEGAEAVAPSIVASAAGRVGSDADPAGPGYSVILLDWLNAGVAERLRGDDAVRKVLKTFQPRQQVGLYVLGTEPPSSAHPARMIRDFTPASPEIADAVEDPGVLPGFEIGETPSRFDARFGSAARRASMEENLFDWNIRILDTLRALSDLAGRMARLPGRKSLVWLTTGFPVVINGRVVPGAKPAEAVYLDEVERAIARLNHENVVVHTVDTIGLGTMTSSHGCGDTLREFAERTGGTAFSARNDLDAGVRIALEDMRAGYTLGFLAPDGAPPGLHKIQVRTRRPRVKLRFRESYQRDG